MYEQVEVFTNPRGRRSHKHDDMVDVHLTKAEIRRALTTKTRKKKSTAVATTKKKKKKRRKRRGGGNPKNILPQLIIGAGITAALEVYVFRNPQWKKQIPQQVRRFSGLIMAVMGFALTMLRGRGMAYVRPVGGGMVAAGVFLQLKEMLVQMRKDAVISEVDKMVAEQLGLDPGEVDTGTEGLGRLPRSPRVTSREAAIRLGMQSRVPFHPHGMGGELGELVDLQGLGSFVTLPGGVQDPAMDARLLTPSLGQFDYGLGEFTNNSSDAWLDGQFAWRDEPHESW